MNTPKKQSDLSDEKRELRNSPALFEFYRALTALNVVLVGYVQGDKHSRGKETNREIEAYSIEPNGVEERAKMVTQDIQHLLSRYQNGSGCGPGETWDPATKTCGPSTR